jgi:hypothetical protein
MATEKKKTLYHEFMSTTLQRLAHEYKELTNKERFRIAHMLWQDHVNNI